MMPAPAAPSTTATPSAAMMMVSVPIAGAGIAIPGTFIASAAAGGASGGSSPGSGLGGAARDERGGGADRAVGAVTQTTVARDCGEADSRSQEGVFGHGLSLAIVQPIEDSPGVEHSLLLQPRVHGRTAPGHDTSCCNICLHPDICGKTPYRAGRWPGPERP